MNKKNVFLFLMSVLVVVSGYKLFENYKVEKLALCLAQKKAVFYGAKWCEHCNHQKLIFGKAFEHVDYVECSRVETMPQLQECFEKGINRYPTWVFSDGTKAVGVLKLETLDEKSGCNVGV